MVFAAPGGGTLGGVGANFFVGFGGGIFAFFMGCGGGGRAFFTWSESALTTV